MYFFVKFFLDIFFALVFSVLTLPIILIFCFLIFLEDRSLPIFVGNRVGLNRKEFLIFKLRSMRKNADRDGAYFTSEDDLRITTIGKIIRKLSIDELPQIWNVFLGQMSFVGPRPDNPIQRKDYSEQQWNKRCSIKPGITGLAQVELRSSGTLEDRTRLDLEYVDKVSFILDLKIIIKTLKVILLRKNVN